METDIQPKRQTDGRRTRGTDQRKNVSKLNNNDRQTKKKQQKLITAVRELKQTPKCVCITKYKHI